MRDISIRRIRIVLAGRAMARDAARELGGAVAAAVGTALASAADAHPSGGSLDTASIGVRVPMHASALAMAAAVGAAVESRMRNPGTADRP